MNPESIVTVIDSWTELKRAKYTPSHLWHTPSHHALGKMHLQLSLSKDCFIVWLKMGVFARKCYQQSTITSEVCYSKSRKSGRELAVLLFSTFDNGKMVFNLRLARKHVLNNFATDSINILFHRSSCVCGPVGCSFKQFFTHLWPAQCQEVSWSLRRIKPSFGSTEEAQNEFLFKCVNDTSCYRFLSSSRLITLGVQVGANLWCMHFPTFDSITSLSPSLSLSLSLSHTHTHTHSLVAHICNSVIVFVHFLSSLLLLKHYCNPGNFRKLINFINWRFWHFIINKLLIYITGSVSQHTLILENYLVSY